MLLAARVSDLALQNFSHSWRVACTGARPDEAVSWGKLRLDAKPTKIYADATILVPLIVSQTFAKLTAEEKAARAASRRSAQQAAQPSH